MSRVKAVYIRSLAYSGTTWVNLLLGCHDRAFALGVPDRIWSTDPADRTRLCSIHGAACDFWPRFFDGYDRHENAVVRLARLSSKDVVLMNNINMTLLRDEVMHSDVDLHYIIVLRDGRANVTSALRHTPQLFSNRYHAINTWLRPAWKHLFDGIPDDPQRTLVLKYEDMVENLESQLAVAGKFLGISYPLDAAKFWEYDHHYIGGNTGTMGLLRDMRGIPRSPHAREDYYRGLAESARIEPDKPLLDESWKSILTREDLILYDYLIGSLHESMGYQRDAISEDEKFAVTSKYGLPEDPAEAPEDIDYSSPPLPVAPVETIGDSGWRRLVRRLLHR